MRKKNKKHTIAWALSTSAIFFIVGMAAYAPILKLLEPTIEGIQFIIKGKLTAFLFSLVLGLIPAMIANTWQLASIHLLNRKIFSIIITACTIGMALFVRHQQVKSFFNRIVRPALLVNGKTHIVYPIDPRNFVYYLFGGLITGCILSYMLFRKNMPVNIKTED